MRVIAFNYEEQRWLEGEAARGEQVRQVRETLALLEGARGDEYCRFIGCPDKGEAIAAGRAMLTKLEGEAAR